MPVYTLLVQVGRKPGDGLPDGATGAAILCYAPASDEEGAVRDTVALLKQAEMAPLDVTGYGALAERQEAGDVSEEEQKLMAMAEAEDSVVVAEMTPFFD